MTGILERGRQCLTVIYLGLITSLAMAHSVLRMFFRIFLTECSFSFASAISVLNVRAVSYLL